MDDLLGEDWQSTASKTKSNGTTSYSSLRPSPQPVLSSPSTPLSLSRPSSTVTGGPARPATSDAFGSLVGIKGRNGSTTGPSIQERQRQINEQGRLLDELGSGGTKQSKQQAVVEDDILAAFNKDAKVDNSSYYPPPAAVSTSASAQPQTGQHIFADDDDTFGLSTLAPKSNGTARPVSTNDDDILGDLGKPLTSLPPKPLRSRSESSSSGEGWNENVAQSRSRKEVEQPADGALAELVDMGFPIEQARTALAESDGDTQRAVGWLLHKAHEGSKNKMREEAGTETDRRRSPMRRQDDSHSSGQVTDGTGPSGKDASQIAQELGSKFFKSANSLWKASQKQMAKTMADFQQERDPAQPKWMQGSSTEGSREGSRRPQQRRVQPDHQAESITNEAALLDMPRDDVPVKAPRAKASSAAENVRSRPDQPVSQFQDDETYSRTRSSTPNAQNAKPMNRVTRQAVEEQSAQAYVSPARRRKAAPPAPKAEPEVDLFSPDPVKATTNGAARVGASSPASRSIATPRPSVPQRSIPTVSAAALSTSAGHRKRGTDAFKRGDYAAAHEAYTAALTPLPSTHPLIILVLSNRALTALKTGDAKMAVSDADRAIDLIGPGLGNDETIDVDGALKDMRELYGKALMRKAEAFEHLEKWQEAGAVWRIAVAAGIGGSVSIRGKERCDRAAAPRPKPAPKPVVKAAAVIKSKPTTTGASTAAVQKLRQANAAAEKADDEKFQLAEQVEARLTTWKGGKADNLRALLQSLDVVLWSNAGWKKVGMSDLVMPNKVKIIYMKAIAKVHPDKIAQDASTEERMISAAVFSTLNEAWDKFKKDNNL